MTPSVVAGKPADGGKEHPARDLSFLGRAHVPGLLVLAIALAIVVRAVPVLSSDWPLHDGGLFMVMIQDLRDAHFVLPLYSTYNLDQIPFAYPPLAIYLTALLNAAGLDLVGLMRSIPLFASVATVPVVYILTIELTGRRSIAGVAAVALALAPRSYEWLIIGGGLTRAPGMLFALLAIWQGIRLLRHPSVFRIAMTGLAGGATILTHPEASLFCVVSLALLLISRGRTWRGMGAMVAAGALALAIASPFLWVVLSRHGVDAISAAAGSRTALLGNTMRTLIFGQFTGATAFDLFLGIGFVGLLVEIGRGRYLVPLWVLVTPVVILGAGFTYSMVPWSILVAVAVVDVLVPAVDRLAAGRPFGRPLLDVGLVGAAVLASLATGFGTDSPIHELRAEDRTAMVWASENLPVGADVAVVTGLPWWNDASSEWFPAIARRHSIATPQGYEWTAYFVRQQERDRLLQDTCGRGTAACLRAWADHFDVRVDYVYIPKGKLAGLASNDDCCPALRQSTRDEFLVIYDGPGATIARVTQ